MVWTTTARARRAYRCCSCNSGIAAEEIYLSLVASPNHDDLGYPKWWRLQKCRGCAERHNQWP